MAFAMTVTLTLAFAVLNLLLGAAMAVGLRYLGESPSPRVAPTRPRRTTPPVEKESPPIPLLPEKPVTEEETPPLPPLAEEIPDAWLDLLEEEGIVAQSFVEATAAVLRLKVCQYRDDLVTIEDRVRRCANRNDPRELEKLLSDLSVVNQSWLDVQSEALGLLSSQQGSLEKLQEVATILENILMEQTAQIETTRGNIELLNEEQSYEARKVLWEIARLIDCAHKLRDQMQESLVAVMVAEQRLEEVDSKWQLDTLCALPNRAGLETLIRRWLAQDERQERVACLLLFDVDCFARINQKLGSRMGDRFLAALSHYMEGLLRQDRGYDRLGRFSGQQFLAFLGDTGPQSATSCAERVRQSVAEATFRLKDIALAITVSCGVVEIDPRQPLEESMERVRNATAAAQRGGNNRTFVDGGNGPRSIEPPQYRVKPKEISLDEPV